MTSLLSKHGHSTEPNFYCTDFWSHLYSIVIIFLKILYALKLQDISSVLRGAVPIFNC
jgi:hypothetical protein